MVTLARILFTAWVTLLAFFGSFSAFGTACNDCQDQINRGTVVIGLALLAIYLGTMLAAAKALTNRRRLAVLGAGAVGAGAATWGLVVALMPL